MKTVLVLLLLSVSGCSIVHYTAEVDLSGTEQRAAVLHYRQGDSAVHLWRCGALPLLLVPGLQGNEPLQSLEYRDTSGASCLLLQQEGEPVMLMTIRQGQYYQLQVQCQQPQLPAAGSYAFGAVQQHRQWLWPWDSAPWVPEPCAVLD